MAIDVERGADPHERIDERRDGDAKAERRGHHPYAGGRVHLHISPRIRRKSKTDLILAGLLRRPRGLRLIACRRAGRNHHEFFEDSLAKALEVKPTSEPRWRPHRKAACGKTARAV